MPNDNTGNGSSLNLDATTMTEADRQRAKTLDESRDSNAGVGQDAMNMRSLQFDIDALTQKKDSGVRLTRAEEAELSAKINSLEYQRGIYNAVAEQTGGMERRDYENLHGNTGTAKNLFQSDKTQVSDIQQQQLESARDANMTVAVLRVMKEHGIGKMDAMSFITKAIETDGEAAEAQYLPQYYSIKQRQRTIAAASQQQQAAPVSAGRAEEPSSLDRELERSMGTFRSAMADVKAALDAGRTPTPKELERLKNIGYYLDIDTSAVTG